MWWENNFLKVKSGNLFIGGKEAAQIAKEWGTPLFLYSKKQIIANYHALLDVFMASTPLQVRIHYAMKANPNRDLLEIIRNTGAGIDAVSPGEVKFALDTGFAAEKILFTGTSLSEEDMCKVLEHENIIFNIDAEEQLEMMKEVRDKWYTDRKTKISLRWNPGIGCGFNSKVVTAGKKAPDGTPIKFGVEERKVLPLFHKASTYGFVPLGLHQHLGSGWVEEDFEAVTCAVDKMIEKAVQLQKEGYRLEFLDFGGGFGPSYSEHQKIFPLKKYAAHICRKMAQSGLNIKAIALEPGKYLVGNAGLLLMRVEYVKKSYGNLFACVNAGTFNTVPRPAIYTEAQHPIINCSRIHSKQKARVTVAGNLCETGDLFGKEMLMPLPKSGDTLALLLAGAYCRSMASNFNLREIPKEIII
jgi:diaminopimelate decarboxylase